jgi:cytoskeletal protein CcmA (bactofilin family)
MGAGSMVLRWMHASGTITAAAHCRFHGRLSSDEAIQLGPWCEFERVNAPRIEFGNPHRGPFMTAVAEENQLDAPLERMLLKGNFQIPAGDVVHGSVVASGTIRIGRGARIRGSIKSNGDLVIEEGVQVEGSAISSRNMMVARNCRIHGPVLAEHEISIATGSCCGSSQQPTTVSAPVIRIQPGAVAFGTVWAKEQGGVKT